MVGCPPSTRRAADSLLLSVRRIPSMLLEMARDAGWPAVVAAGARIPDFSPPRGLDHWIAWVVAVVLQKLGDAATEVQIKDRGLGDLVMALNEERA